MKNNLKNLGLTLKIILQIFSILGIIFLLGLYSITKLLNLHFDLFVIMIYPCGISFLYLVYQFINLFGSLKNNNPFCHENVKRLSNSMVCSLIICIFDKNSKESKFLEFSIITFGTIFVSVIYVILAVAIAMSNFN